MAYNELLANRVREALAGRPNVEEKKMFRGITFMMNGKMCVSIGDNELMFRIDPSFQETALEKPGAREMIHGGRTMKGFIFVNEDGVKTIPDFNYWISAAIYFNKHAKASKPKKNK